MTAKLAKGGLTLEGEYAMKRAPRGFEDIAEADIASAVRNKSFICSRPIAATRLAERGLVDDIVAFAKHALPLLEWGWSAVVDERG